MWAKWLHVPSLGRPVFLEGTNHKWLLHTYRVEGPHEGKAATPHLMWYGSPTLIARMKSKMATSALGQRGLPY